MFFGSEDSGDETDDTKASMCAVANGIHVLKGKGEEQPPGSSIKRRATVSYNLHVNFGNEQLESAVEIKFVVNFIA